MKPLKVLGKIFLIGCFWSLFFIEGIRVILLINWHFDIFWAPHWAYLWNLWHSGWVINHAKEWAFILILLAAIPMWFTGWIFLSTLNWRYWFNLLVVQQIQKIKSYINDLNAPMRNDLAIKKVVKKKSYKEIRPNAHGAPASVDPFENHPVASAIRSSGPSFEQNASLSQTAPAAISTAPSSFSSAQQTEEKKPFTHSVFDFDNDEEDDFDLDFDAAIKSIQKPSPAQSPKQSVFDIDEDHDRNQEEYISHKNAKHSLYDSDFDDNDEKEDDYEILRRSPRENDSRSRNSDRRENRRDIDRGFEHSTRRSSRDDVSRRQKNIDRQNEARQPRTNNSNPIVETLRQKGYNIITGQTIKNTYIDYIAVSDSVVALCLVDKEIGDWLADEERFNDEEPLWFSESNHRISPVRLVDIARNALAQKLHDCNITFDVRAFVIEQSGNIINAEDMFEIWRSLDVDVTRINRGSPKEIPLFSKSLEEVDNPIDALRFESLKKLIRSID